MIGIKLNRIFGKKGENIKDEKGAVPIVEATFIFPIVFFCMFFLIYIGMYILQSVLIYTQTQKVASIVSKSMAVTGYEKVGKHTADNVNFDFKDNKYFTQDSVNTIYDEKAKLYRYFYTILKYSNKCNYNDDDKYDSHHIYFTALIVLKSIKL